MLNKGNDKNNKRRKPIKIQDKQQEKEEKNPHSI